MRPTLRAALLACIVTLVWSSHPAAAQTPEPYRDPPFVCDVIDYGTDPPPIPGPEADPLCVRYDKTNITVSTLGVIDFLAAEPGRVTIVAAKCSFWQQDEWSIRASPDTPPLVSWSGSYWYDATSGSAAGVLRDLRVADQPASGDAFITALRPIVGDEQADEFATFTDDGGGGGVTMALPDGFAYEECAAGNGEAPEGGTPDEQTPGDGEAVADAPSAPRVTAGAGGDTLPATGTRVPLAGLMAIAVVAAAVRWTVGRSSRSV